MATPTPDFQAHRLSRTLLAIASLLLVSNLGCNNDPPPAPRDASIGSRDSLTTAADGSAEDANLSDLRPNDAPALDLAVNQTPADSAPVTDVAVGGIDCSGIEAIPGRPTLVATPVVSDGLNGLVDLAFPDGDAGRILALEYQKGTVTLIKNGALAPRPFLDLSARVLAAGAEQGLLSIALHPHHASNRKFYLYYNSASCPKLPQAMPNGCTRLTEFKRDSRDPDVAEPGSERELLNVPQQAANHNGGAVRFGPDGYLYLSVGDGGGDAGTSRAAGGFPQDPSDFRGKLLRIDVDRTDTATPYGVPEDNPFVTNPSFNPEIAFWGLRNPWRFSFDSESGELWIGDVGAGSWEETNFVAAGVLGLNFGWPCFEGNLRRLSEGPCSGGNFAAPFEDHPHERENFQSIVGGIRYRGCKMPGYHDTYFYADIRRGLQSLQLDKTGRPFNDVDVSSVHLPAIVSLAEDPRGEIYILTLNDGLFRLEAKEGSAAARLGLVEF